MYFDEFLEAIASILVFFGILEVIYYCNNGELIIQACRNSVTQFKRNNQKAEELRVAKENNSLLQELTEEVKQSKLQQEKKEEERRNKELIKINNKKQMALKEAKKNYLKMKEQLIQALRKSAGNGLNKATVKIICPIRIEWQYYGDAIETLFKQDKDFMGFNIFTNDYYYNSEQRYEINASF